jgi:hypothetical protein
LSEEAELKDLKENKETRGVRLSSENLRLRSMALQYYADICEDFESDELIRRIYKTVFEWSPENPYSFVKLLEYDPSLLINITVIRKNVADAIDKCREHIRLGIESLNAYFTIGKLSLILKEDYQALNAYLKAITLCSSDMVCITQDTINSEIKSLARINSKNIFTPASDWIDKVLLLFKVIKFKDSKAISTLKSESLISGETKEPVIIVVGGADNLEKSVGKKFSSYLKVAVKRFGATIISGGTKSGIPGILGSAVADAMRGGNKKIILIGYIPEKVIRRVEIDQTYKIIKTEGTEFSPLESIMMWIDLISSGIKPASVRVLGINGGRISGFEYRLALSLGAHLGVVEKTGGAVDEILTDLEWKAHQNLHILPDEAESIWAFINHKISPVLTKRQLEDTAKIIHNNYLKEQSEQKSKELNLKPWNELRKDLKDSNLSQAVYMSEILNLGGFGIRKSTSNKSGIMRFKKEEILKMSKLEHGRFVAERLMKGWKSGQKNIDNKISPSLVSWDELPKEIQKLDINNVKNFPILLKEAGYEVYRLKK